MTRLPVISLFSGAMGLDIGLEQAGFEIRVAVENDPRAVKTIRHNKPGLPVIEKDIREVSTNEVLDAANLKEGEPALVAGGPCCQAFSTAGKRGSLSDQRGSLFLHFLRIVNESQPDFYLMENVKGLLSAAIRHRPLSERTPEHSPLTSEEIQGSAFAYVLSQIKEMGGQVMVDLVNAADFGVAQKRERLVIIGSLKGYSPLRLDRTHENKWGTLRQSLEGLNDENPICSQISPKLAHFVSLIPPGGNWRSLPENLRRNAVGDKVYNSWGGRTGFLRRLDWEKPSPTLTGCPSGRATMMIHPDVDRVLSIAEYKRLQEFPDDWKIEGSMSSQYQQIGNAIPIGLAKALGENVKSSMHHQEYSASDAENTRIFTYNRDLYEKLSFMKHTTISPHILKEFGRDRVKEWLGNMSNNNVNAASLMEVNA